MATVSIYRNIRKKVKNGNNPIQVRVTHDRKSKYITIGYNGKGLNGNSDNFDDSAKLFNDAEPNYKAKNGIIRNKLTDAERLIKQFEFLNTPFSFKLFEREFIKKSRKNSIINFFDEEIERLRTAKRYGYVIPYVVTRDHIKAYHGSSDLRFEQINYSFLTGFESYLMARTIKDRPVKKSTLSVYMRTLRTVFNSAIKSGLCLEKDYPFASRTNMNGYSLASLKHESPKRAITNDQVKQIKNYLLATSSRQYEYRNFWLFMYYCRGMNFADIADLEWSDIIEGRLQYNRNKNNRSFNILLIPEALEILEFYKGKGKGNFIFPIHNEVENTEARYYHTKNMLKLMNTSMNRITKKLEIDANLTTYVARHTWATGLKNKGYSATVISEGLGHSSEKTTLTYLRKFESSVLDEAGKDIL